MRDRDVAVARYTSCYNIITGLGRQMSDLDEIAMTFQGYWEQEVWMGYGPPQDDDEAIREEDDPASDAEPAGRVFRPAGSAYDQAAD